MLLDRFEVTVGRFQTFLAAYATARFPADDAGAHPNVPGSGWKTAWSENPTLMPPTAESVEKGVGVCSSWPAIDELNLPMRCVNWYLAMAFCIWDGGRLPTEAEWTLAAAGGDEQRYFPWSVDGEDRELDPERACYSDTSPRMDKPMPVATHPRGAGPFGHEDLAGNVWEWTADAYRERLSKIDCSGDEHSKLTVDCQTSQETDSRVLKGGSFASRAQHLANINRSGSFPAMRDPTIGFRCARDN